MTQDEIKALAVSEPLHIAPAPVSDAETREAIAWVATTAPRHADHIEKLARENAALRERENPLVVSLEAAIKDAERAEAEREVLREAGDRLSVCAQTTGGTAGRDDGLVKAIEGWAKARAAPPAQARAR